MQTLFLACAALGGVVLLLQLVLAVVGVGAEGLDIPDGDMSEGLQLLSVRTLSAGAAFFGLGGLAVLATGLGLWAALPVALLAGVAAMVGMAVLMRAMLRLEEDGSLELERAIGETGTVYLRIPGGRAGAGKVLLTVQNRTVECQAVTRDAELPTGATVTVVDIVGPDTVEVVSSSSTGVDIDVAR